MLVEVLVNTLANISMELGIGSAADHSMGYSRTIRAAAEVVASEVVVDNCDFGDCVF